MRRTVIAAVAALAMACAGADPTPSNEATYGMAPDGSLQCGTLAAPASVTPVCGSPTTCTCDFACVYNPNGGNASLHAEFTLQTLGDGGTGWQVTASALGAGC